MDRRTRVSESAPEPPIYYGELPPGSGLRPFVTCYWHWRVRSDVGPFTHTVPPDGSVSLLYMRGLGFGLMGPRTEPMQVPSGGGRHVWGVRFRPGATAGLDGLDANALRNQTRFGPLPGLEPQHASLTEALASDPGEEEAAAAWEAALLPLFQDTPPVDGAVVRAVSSIFHAGGKLSIADLGPKVGLSPRQLRRRFRTATGLSPKELARVCRVRSSLIEAFFSEEWAALAAAHGFADQAHLTNEYRRLAGDSPERYLRYLRTIEHGGEALRARDRFLQDANGKES